MSQRKGGDVRNSSHTAAPSYNAEGQGEGQTDGKVKRSRAWIPCSFFFLAVCTAVGVAIGWRFRVKNFEDKENTKTHFGGRIVRRFNNHFWDAYWL